MVRKLKVVHNRYVWRYQDTSQTHYNRILVAENCELEFGLKHIFLQRYGVTGLILRKCNCYQQKALSYSK